MTRGGLFAIAVIVALAMLWFIAIKLRNALPFFVSVLRSVGHAIKDNPDVQDLVARYPILFSFLSDRLSRQAFTGLPVTILASAFVYFLILYAGSTLDFYNQSQIVAVDVRVANLLSAFRDPNLTRFFTLATALGSWLSVTILDPRAVHYLPGLWLSLIGNQLTVTLLKYVFARPRPDMAVYAESSFSFPSGHSAASIAFFGFLTYLLVRERVGPIFVSFLAGATVVLLIGLSRIYLVEHYLSDVLNGYLVGVLWALLGIWLAEWLHSKRDRNKQILIPFWRNVAAIAALASALLAVGVFVKDYQQTLNIPSVVGVEQLKEPVTAAFADGRLPSHSENILGQPQEPISLIILAKDEAAFLEAFSKAGWQLADRPGISTLSRAAFAVWFSNEYDTAPITPAFWNGQPHDFGFQAETADKSLRERHHARFWRSGFRTADGQAIFLGTASFDVGLKWGLTHRIDPNIDAERDFLATGLSDTGLVSSQERIQLAAPVLGQNLTGDPFFTDGKAILLRIGADSNSNPVNPGAPMPR